MFTRNLGRGASLEEAPGGTPPARMDQLRGISVPTLVLVGDHEMPYFLIVAQALAYGITDAQHSIIPDAGHAAHLGQPDRFNGEVLRFLSWLGGTASPGP